MLLFLTNNENEFMLEDILKETKINNYETITNITDLKKFSKQDIQNLNNFEYLVIDISVIKNSEEDIISALVSIKTMYSIKIVIIAVGYQDKNSLLGKIFAEGIYNIVTSTQLEIQKEEIIKCLSDGGKTYKEAIRFRNDELSISNSNRVVIKKEYKKLKQYVIISVAGTQSRVGVTTQALLITNFLNSINLRACYIQSNSKSDIEKLEKFYNIKKTENYINYNGIDMYYKGTAIDAIEYGYDFYVFDWGVIDNINDSYITSDVKIIVSCSNAWEYESLNKVFEKIEKINNINFIFNFTPEDMQKIITKNMGKFKLKTYFTEYTPDVFSQDKNIEIYHRILKDYVSEKNNFIEIIDKRKSNLLGLFRGKK